MRILIINNASMNVRDEHYFTNNLNGSFLEELINNGHEVSFLQFVNTSQNTINDYDLSNNGIHCLPLVSRGSKLARYLKAIFKIWHSIMRADFVYVYLPNTLKVATYICRIQGKPYGAYVRGMKELTSRKSVDIYKKATVIFTVSEGFSETIKEKSKNCSVYSIKPMIPYTDLDIIEDRQYAVPDEYSLLFLGRITFDKGICELVYAVKELYDEGRVKCRLTIVGDGEYMEKAKLLISNLRVEQYVKIIGPVYDESTKRRLFSEAHIFILPTYHEGFPRTLYEAMIFGTPIITTFVGGIPSLMKDKVNCLRIEPKSVASIKEGLSFAFLNYHDMGRFAINAKETVRPVISHKRLTHAQHLNQILQSLYYNNEKDLER